MPNTQLLTETEVAELMKISPRTLQHWRVAGGGPAYMKFGHNVRYSRETIEAWMRQRTLRHTADTPPGAGATSHIPAARAASAN